MHKSKLPLLLAGLMLGVCLGIAVAQQPTPTSSPTSVETADSYVKLFGGIITGIVAICSIPVTYLSIRKTRAETRKLELEAATLEANLPIAGLLPDGESPFSHRIVFQHSDNNTVQILADPRFLAPLLILLDFVRAWIVLTLLNYALGAIEELYFIKEPITIGVGLILLIPIWKEVRHTKGVLTGLREPQTQEDKGAQEDTPKPEATVEDE